MARKLFSLMLVLCLILLAGCYHTPTPTTPTTTPFPTQQTPLQMLNGAMGKTLGATSFTLTYSTADAGKQYTTRSSASLTRDGKGNYQALITADCGCSRYINGNTAKHFDCKTGAVTTQSQDDPYGLDFILQDLPALTPAVLDRFCNTSLIATPDKTGTTRFSVSDLTPAQLCALLGHADCPGSATGDPGFFALTLDKAGYLTAVEYTDCPPAARTHKIQLSQLNQNLTITVPQWAA